MRTLEPSLAYDCDRGALGSTLAARFKPLTRDAETDAWLQHYVARPHSKLVTQLTHLLSSFLSSYDAHGILGSYAMHLLSASAFVDLLGPERKESMLDVGAGAGYVTENARALFDRIECTETSSMLRRRLKQKGFTVHALDLSESSLGHSFDVVCCLNVLDRTARPMTLLRNLLRHLNPNGKLVLALPLPLSPHVHVAGGTIAPSERLSAKQRTWEGAARELTESLLLPAGLNVVRLSRAPYLSRGDSAASVYTLDDAVWVCERSSTV